MQQDYKLANRETAESNVFNKQIKPGLMDLEVKQNKMATNLIKKVDIRKEEIEKIVSTKVQEAKDRLIAQAALTHNKFMIMLANNMSQYTANVQNL